MKRQATIGLMRRITQVSYSSLSEEVQLEQITQLQQARLAAIAASSQVKAGTKSAARNKAKTASGRSSIKNDQKKLADLLAKLTPEQIAAIKQNIS